MHDWTTLLSDALAREGRSKVAIPTVFTSPVAVQAEFKKTPDYQKLIGMGVVLSYICPLMYMNNPLSGKMPVVTNSNKLRTYTSARYHNGCGDSRHSLERGQLTCRKRLKAARSYPAA